MVVDVAWERCDVDDLGVLADRIACAGAELLDADEGAARAGVRGGRPHADLARCASSPPAAPWPLSEGCAERHRDAMIRSPSRIDFLAPAPHPRARPTLLAAAALALTPGRASRRRARCSVWSRSAAAPGALVARRSAAPAAMTAEDRRRHAQLDALARYLAAPWAELLSALEERSPGQAVLQRVEQDAATGLDPPHRARPPRRGHDGLRDRAGGRPPARQCAAAPARTGWRGGGGALRFELSADWRGGGDLRGAERGRWRQRPDGGAAMTELQRHPAIHRLRWWWHRQLGWPRRGGDRAARASCSRWPPACSPGPSRSAAHPCASRWHARGRGACAAVPASARDASPHRDPRDALQRHVAHARPARPRDRRVPRCRGAGEGARCAGRVRARGAGAGTEPAAHPVPVSDSYPKLRGLIGTVLERSPNAALDTLEMEAAGDGSVLDGRLQFSLWFRREVQP